MKKPSARIRRRILVPITATILLLIIAGVGSVYWIQSRSNQARFESEQAGVEQLFAELLDEEAQVLDSQLHFLQADQTLQSAFLAQDRDMLLERATPTFERMRDEFRVTHFYFINTDRTIFLRVHNSPEYGDVVHRFTLNNAITSGAENYGIELGRFGTLTLRFVQPWMIDGKLAGYLELGMEIDHLTPRLQSILDSELLFVIDKQFLTQTDWEEGLEMLGREGEWNALPDSVIIDETISLPGDLLSKYATHHSEATFFNFSFERNTFQGGYVPLVDAGDRVIGQIIVLDNVTGQQADLRGVIIGLIIAGVALGTALLASFYGLTGRIEHLLAKEEELVISDVRAQEQKLLQSIIQNAGAAISVKDRDGRFLLANEQYLELVNRTDIKGKTLHDIEPASVADEAVATDARILQSGKPEQMEVTLSHNGTSRHFIDSRFPIPDASGIIYAIGSVATDITYRKQAEQERERLITDLKIANRMAQENARLKSEFLATMSHELRTPMNAIEGFTSIILSGMGGVEYNDKVARYLGKVNTNSKRLLQLINDFLDLSRIESGRFEPACMPMSPANLAQTWYEELSVLAEKKGLKFEIIVDPGLPETMLGDGESVSKIAINLLGNAIKFTEQGKVSLAVQCGENGNWTITVSDTGIGIPAHAREYIFDEFRQVDQSSKRTYGGTGLGLAIVQRLTRAMGGTVSLTSQIGEGSTFVVSLPIRYVAETV